MNALACPLPERATEFIISIESIAPLHTEIWLIGSYANNKQQQNSDVDLLIFGSVDLLGEIRKKLNQPSNIDCLIVYDGNNFLDPWSGKSGSLNDLSWKKVNSHTANYVGRKWIQDIDETQDQNMTLGNFCETSQKARRISPKH